MRVEVIDHDHATQRIEFGLRVDDQETLWTCEWLLFPADAPDDPGLGYSNLAGFGGPSVAESGLGESPVAPLFSLRSGLRCTRELFSDTVYDHVENPVRFAAVEAAVDDWWVNGDGSYRSDRELFLTETEHDEATARVLYFDDWSAAQLILFLSKYQAGWLVDRHQACA